MALAVLGLILVADAAVGASAIWVTRLAELSLGNIDPGQAWSLRPVAFIVGGVVSVWFFRQQRSRKLWAAVAALGQAVAARCRRLRRERSRAPADRDGRRRALRAGHCDGPAHAHGRRSAGDTGAAGRRVCGSRPGRSRPERPGAVLDDDRWVDVEGRRS